MGPSSQDNYDYPAPVLPMHPQAPSGPARAVPRAVARAVAPEGPKLIRLAEHPAWDRLRLFRRDEDAERMVPADADLCIVPILAASGWKAMFRLHQALEDDTDLPSIIRRWGAPGEIDYWDDPSHQHRIRYKFALRSKTGNDRPGKPITEYTVTRDDLPLDLRDEVGEEAWPVDLTGAPQFVSEEMEARTEAREEERLGPSGDPQGPGAGRAPNPFSAGQPLPAQNVWGASTPTLGSPQATQPAPPPFPAEPGKKWAWWNGSWFQVADPTADLPPSYPPAAGMVWAKLNGAWQQIRDPSAPATPGLLDGLIKNFSTNPVETLTALGGAAMALKQVFDSFKGPAPAPAAPAVDVAAQLAAARAEMETRLEAERRQRAEQDRERLENEKRRAEEELRRALAQAQANAGRPRDPAEEFSKFIEQTKKNAKLLNMTEADVDRAADGANSTQEFLLNLADTEAGKVAVGALTTGFMNWISRQPPASLEPIPGSRAALAAGTPPPEALPSGAPGAQGDFNDDAPPGQ